ncbi:MAG: IS3 family transposase, partial [Candidatus Riflebacteria bacterium]|nr:IS3 family transposase [Candidatus Riflebacteria bacterium]
MLRFLGVSRSGYYSFKKRESELKSSISRKEMLKSIIYKLWTESKQIYGAPKIREELKKMGVSIAERTVGAYMHEMGIKACYIKKPYRQKKSGKAFNTS